MTQNLATKYPDDLLFLPLGGSGEIGMNLNMYCHKGKWLLVDYGAGFADEFLPGVDMIVPDIDFIRKNKHNVVGLMLTHAHEDHIGGLVHVWENFDFPIYASPFTAAFVREKMRDSKMTSYPEIVVVRSGDRLNVGPFDVECVHLTHSTPEMHALCIRTDVGNIFHTGDWKFDPDPVAGDCTDMERLRQLGDEGILMAIGDSTNVFSEGHSGSEGELLDPIAELVAGTQGMAVVTTFASNVARLETLMRVAEKTGRHAVMAGRSLWRIYRAACQSGYFQDLPEPLTDRSIGNLAKKNTLAIVTGCQGEPMAAMSKILNGRHPTIRLAKSDAVIFSSKIIPGNDKRIHFMINELIRRDIAVFTTETDKVHVSGHPRREELKKLYSLLRPKIVIPMHGEDMHLREHALFAKEECGVPKTIRLHNGDVLRMTKHDADVVDKVEAGYFAVDGSSMLPPHGSVMKMRRRMVKDGVVCVALVVDRGEAFPIVAAPGLLDQNDDADLITALKEEIDAALQGMESRKKRGTFKDLEQSIRQTVRRFCQRELGKNPPVEIVAQNI
ncbi:MAG: ribonuclease J [Rickettsiales bacterium]